MPALDGMRVLDMTQYEAGTACTQALAWLDADVVKIERPGSGDPGRGLLVGGDHSAYFLSWNANKRSVAVALEKPEGRELLLRMLPRYDVFVENFGPGVLEKLGLEYEAMRAVHPAIIHARIKGFGGGGPYASYKCFDMVAQAASGAFSVTGEPDGPPMCPGPTLADSGTGVQAALAITAAYVQRLRTGEGQQIEIAMQEAMTFYMRTRIANGSEWGSRAVPRTGNGEGPMLNLYPCKPGGPNDYVYLVVATPRMWDQLCSALDRPDLASDPRFKGWLLRHENGAALYEEIASWTREHTKHEAMRILAEAGVPCSAVLDTRDLFQDPQLAARGFVKRVKHEVLGEVPILGSPFRLSQSEVELRAAPVLGRHTDEVLREDLGLSDSDLRALHASGVVATKES
ncbi:MAG: formyl-CoA transferase [Deltaproteobacteria bacterium]|nr:formyl-CoA transferase [Deltaproteobacteria bacterium]